jgi:hypothetical protein
MQRSLTNYHIKLLAAALMVIDHVGYVFFPDAVGFRILGRLSFPLFAWLLAQGEAHTRDVQKYALRLVVWGLVSQPLYQLTFDTQQINILFTLLLGLGCLRMARLFPRWQGLTWVCGYGLAEVAHMDYGGYGIVAIALLGQFQPRIIWWVSWVIFHLIFSLAIPERISQYPAVLAPLLVPLSNQQPGAKVRWFYLFYPLHLAVLLLIKHWVRI